MQQSRIVNIERQYQDDSGHATHIYANLLISTPKNHKDHVDTVASFSEVRTDVLIHDPSKYHISCVRFSLDTSMVPLMILKYYSTMTNGGSVYLCTAMAVPGRANNVNLLQWTPEDPLATGEESMYLWTYQHFLDMFNKSMSDNASSSSITAAQCPVMIYDANTQRFSLVAPAAQWDASTGSGCVFSLSPELAAIFPNFPYTNLTPPVGSISGVYKQLIIRSDPLKSNIVNYTIGGVSTPCVVVTQEIPNLQAFCPMRSVVLATQSIPVAQEAISTPDGEKSFKGSGANNAAISYLTDMVVPTNIGFESTRQRFVYYDANPYRLADMKSSTPMKSLDLQVRWVDDYGVMRPLKLGLGTSCSVKLMFRLKSFSGQWDERNERQRHEFMKRMTT